MSTRGSLKGAQVATCAHCSIGEVPLGTTRRMAPRSSWSRTGDSHGRDVVNGPQAIDIVDGIARGGTITGASLGSSRPVRRPHKGHRLMTPAKPRPIPRPQAPSPAIARGALDAPSALPVADDISAERDRLGIGLWRGRRRPGGADRGRDPHASGPRGRREADRGVRQGLHRACGLGRAVPRAARRRRTRAPRTSTMPLTGLRSSLETPVVVGNLAALACPLRDCRGRGQGGRRQGARRARRRARTGRRGPRGARRRGRGARRQAVAQVHWKNDTARMRELLDEWKEAQRSGARMAKEAEREMWARFTKARSAFEKARKSHFAQLDKENAAVAGTKEDLVEPRGGARDLDRLGLDRSSVQAAHGPVALAGRGRKSMDDALWARFQAAQEAFFTAKRAVDGGRGRGSRREHPRKGVRRGGRRGAAAHQGRPRRQEATSASIQDRFEAAGEVPRGAGAGPEPSHRRRREGHSRRRPGSLDVEEPRDRGPRHRVRRPVARRDRGS